MTSKIRRQKQQLQDLMSLRRWTYILESKGASISSTLALTYGIDLNSVLRGTRALSASIEDLEAEIELQEQFGEGSSK